MENIARYESMAKLRIPADEREKAAAWMDRLTRDFDVIKSVDTEHVEPMYTVLDVSNVLREDAAVKRVPREELLAGAPARSGGYFQVPKTI